MSQSICGVHDLGGRTLLNQANVRGWLVVSESLRDDETSCEAIVGTDHAVVSRLNWSHHGLGTFPKDKADVGPFANKVREYAKRMVSLGVKGHRYVLGNEPNHEVEGNLHPKTYADIYNLAASLILEQDPTAAVGPAAVAPWNATTKYGGNESGDWDIYAYHMYLELRPELVKAIPVHAYSNGPDLGLRLVMGDPFRGRPYGFDAFTRTVNGLPEWTRSRPIWITEMNQNQAWESGASNWFSQAYNWISGYNDRNVRQIVFGAVYRWDKFDAKYSLATHQTAQQEFVLAAKGGYGLPTSTQEAPEAKKEDMSPNIHLPQIEASAGPGTEEPSLQWDPRLDQPPGRPRATLVRARPKPGEQYWALVSGKWLDAKEGGGKVNVFVRAIDSDGKPLGGAQVKFWWDGWKGDFKYTVPVGWIDFPMGRNRAPAYHVRIGDGPAVVSDEVRGMGLGSIEQPDFNEHASYELVFQLRTAPSKPAEQPKPQEKAHPWLIHPVADKAHREISQIFGARGDYYGQFLYDGVPLKGHNGVDFACPEGTLIVAADSGTVDKLDFDEAGFGLHLKLRHSWGWSLYAHLRSTSVKLGDVVKVGDSVGLSGNTGKSSGPHLHFGIQIDPVDRADGWGGYDDPLPYIMGVEAHPVGDQAFYALVRDAAQEFGLDAELLLALAWEENHFTTVQSEAGAMGLLQIMPKTWAEWAPKVGATDPMNAKDNLRVGAAYLDWCIDTAGNTTDGVIAYNWGIGNVLGPNEPPTRTLIYAHAVVGEWQLLKRMGVFG